MLHCQSWSRGTGNAGEWKALTQGAKGGKTEESVGPYLLLSLIPFFPPSIAANLYASN
jgi:hypothetical protein